MIVRKQGVGIDISKDSFTACVATIHMDDHTDYSSVEKFKNDKSGFNQLMRFVRKNRCKTHQPLFLMEATGVYYESLAHHLNKIKQDVCVVLPNTSKHYFSSLNVKTKTDEIDAKILSRFSVERKHRLWSPPNPLLLELRNLTRYYVQLQEQKTAIGNIKHSNDASHDVQAFILKSNTKLIAQIDKQITSSKHEIEVLITGNPALKEKIDKLLTIKGVGLITVATIVAETLGFEQVKNAKQLASYAGYDVVQRESGSSVKGKTRISKKGNRYIRNALYFPAMVAGRYNDELKQVYLRIIKKKPSKMIGQVAIQRKLLLLIYTLWKNETVYVADYKNKVAQLESSMATQDSLINQLL